MGLGFKGIFGANFDKSTNYAKMDSSSTFDVRDLSTGVIASAVSLQNLYQEYQDYQKAVTAKPGLVTLVFTPYKALGGAAADIPNLTELEMTKLEELARKRDRIKTISNDLEVANDAVARGLPTLFKIDSKPEDIRTVIDAYMASIATAVDTCQNTADSSVCIQSINQVGPVPANHVTAQ